MKQLSFVAATALFLAACSGSTAQDAPPAPPNEKAPATFRVNMETSRGPVVIEVTRELAPNGADRFYNLVKARYYDGSRFYRVVPGFMVQWGAAADPKVSKRWEVPIDDDPVMTSNDRGAITFAASSNPNSRTSHLFINFVDNARLDKLGFAPFGKVVSGMENIDQVYAEDREKPDQDMIKEQGNEYLTKEFPNLDYIKTIRLAD